MIAIAETELTPSQPRLSDCLSHGVPRAYAVLFFSANVPLGWFLLATSLLSPAIGLSGLLGVIAAALLAWMLGLDRANIRNGFCLFNPLLVCLTLGWLHTCYNFAPQVFAVLWLAAVTGGLMLNIAMQQLVGAHLGMSAHSLPAVMAAYVLYFLGYSLYGPPLSPTLAGNAWLDLQFLPQTSQAMFQAFGAMLFLPRALPGVLVFVALALASPLTCLVAAGAFLTGAETMSALGYAPGPEGVSWCGFNFLLCGIALGSGYFVVSRASLVLAMTGAFLCALVAIALSTALRYFGLPASALPYNLVVLVIVFALRQRRTTCGLVASPAPGSLPESAARRVVLNARRFPHLSTPALSLPFEGERIITQSFDGALTHRGAWSHALDFEIATATRGSSLADYPMFDSPVLAPCGGVVAVVVNQVHDNAPGGNNPDENWGNQVLIYGDGGFYVRLAHLKRASITVVVGQRVERGQLLGSCGNSGRSPVPHLHVQVQGSTSAAAPTRAFCLKHYIDTSDESATPVYCTSGVPGKGAHVRPAAVDVPLAALLAGWLPGEYRYRITADHGAAWEETISLDFDETGRYRLTSRRSHARITAFLAEGVFFMTDFEGTDASLLAVISVALARVPCIAEPDARWSDLASVVPFHRGALRWMHQLLDPFIGPSLMSSNYSVEHDGGGWVVRSACADATKLPAHAPRETSVTVSSRRFLQAIEARLANDKVLRAELVNFRAPGMEAETSR